VRAITASGRAVTWFADADHLGERLPVTHPQAVVDAVRDVRNPARTS
jgi:hypothetical protein